MAEVPFAMLDSDEMVSAVETADAVLVEAMKKATVIVTMYDLNQVTAAAARAIERVTELEAQMAEACERLERILAGCEPCEATAEALVREFADAPPGVDATTPTHWDCECDAGYIHPKSEHECPRCHATADESPDSMVREVEAAPITEPELSPQAVEERDWLRSKGLDASAALLLVRWMANRPRGTSTVSEAAAKWDLTVDQALAMVRRYGPIIGQLRELRGTKYDAKLAEFKDRLGVAA